MKKDTKKYEDFKTNPANYIPIDRDGDRYLQRFTNKYAALRMVGNMPIFDKAYKILTERKNYSRKNAFGEMHGDGHLWIEKHPKIQVIVEQWQSFRHIFIKDGSSFHIRGLEYNLNYSAHEKNRLKGISIDKFRKQGFVPNCPKNPDAKRFDAFTYGDDRDDGYIFSGHIPKTTGNKEIDSIWQTMIKCEFADHNTIHAIQSMEQWEHYLDNPDDLE